MVDDYDLIVASLRKEYGFSPREYKDMKYDEFESYLVGLGPNTALGRIVSIRSEDDPEVLKSFTKEQKKIRNDYRNRKAKKVSKEELGTFLDEMKKAFVLMAGGQEAVVSEKKENV